MAVEFMVGNFQFKVQEEKVWKVEKVVTEERSLVSTLTRQLCYDKHAQEVTMGCGTGCASLRAYTKSGLARAIKNEDLDRFGRCHTCQLMAVVGPAREHRKVLECLTPVWRDVEVVHEVVKPIAREVREIVTAPVVTCQLVQKTQTHMDLINDIVAGVQDSDEHEVEEDQSPENETQHEEIITKKPLPYVAPHARILRQISNEMIKREEDRCERIFTLFFNKPAIRSELRRKQFGKLLKENGYTRIKPALDEEIERNLAQAREMNDLEKSFWAQDLSKFRVNGEVRLKTVIACGQSIGFASKYHKRSIKKPVCRGLLRTYHKLHKPVKGQPSNLTRAILNIAQKNKILVEIIKGKRKLTMHMKRVEGRNLACVKLLHESGVRRKRELHPRIFNEELAAIARLNNHFVGIREADVKPGYSGAVLSNTIIKNCNRNYNEMVVRGIHEGKLIDARSKLSYFMMLSTRHFSSYEHDFWQGWKRTFDRLAPDFDHTCIATMPNDQCGEIVAALFQSMHPCKRISCQQCRDSLTTISREEYYEHLNTLFQEHDSVYKELSEKHESLATVLAHARKRTIGNPNIQGISEITRLAQGSKATQMQQIIKIHNVLMKGSIASSSEFADATNNLLEITRWMKNHLTQVEKGSVSTFRNKASSKAALNVALLCDNQLDKNGNFVWGERGYHAKRFFTKFFEVIQPGDGYEKYTKRRNPNGVRLLAIGHLVVPMSLHRARRALEGVTIKRLDITEACISKDYTVQYTCCCVTDDIGKPMFSSIKSPTKSHLVIGNTGDSKYIDLPSLDEERMYIATDGYCYLNIFLAMLVNVNEKDAKDFTKTVRDTIIPMLGTWPTMHDLATACYILTVFHPETKNAELPRILVDHEAQIMHVVDSYGSLSTGYHILKAGTVQQLLPFACESLEGEMKFYKVGGKEKTDSRIAVELALIKGVYRPKKLIELIEQNPYVLFMSLVSPKLIIALYNVGGLDMALAHWISRDTDVSTILSILAYLAQKVSRASIVHEQIKHINQSAQQILAIMNGMSEPSITFEVVKQYLECVSDRIVVDSQLKENGFLTVQDSLYETMEKIYAERLNKEWCDLSWLEKFSLTKHCYSRRIYTSDVLPIIKDQEVEAKYVISCTWFYGKIKEAHAGTKKYIGMKIQEGGKKMQNLMVTHTVRVFHKCFSDMAYLMNVMLIMLALVRVINFIKVHIDEVKSLKENAVHEEFNQNMRSLAIVHTLYTKIKGVPTEEEFIEHLRVSHPELETFYQKQLYGQVRLQNKAYLERNFEKVIAFMALITMIFDERKSDAVFKCLGKIKTVFNTMSDVVRPQSLDEIISIEDEKKETVDFQLDTDIIATSVTNDERFEVWWQNQLDQNRVIPHYRSTGTFLEFTRNTVNQVCTTVQTSAENEFLIRGAVGSGKSTSLPHQLGKKGCVLIIEPTRPLAENVVKQLRKEPFYNDATLRMRGMSAFGSSNVTVMTSGFALHFYANNQALLHKINYVIIDECHVIDASAMAFYCLLKDFDFKGKILKVSATPPGRECEFETQYPVKLRVEEQASIQSFVNAQGTGSNMDVTNDGDNILVYVASYNDVDTMSKLLLEKSFQVTKVDGRTMKMGNVEIITKGTSNNKHFIVATNIIENGVTLDIEVVVDFGQKVQAELDSDLRSMSYSRVSVSYGERIQRLGRVGRVKNGVGLRIGHTEKGISEIPICIATEAAFYCFAYGLPVMTHNVTTSILSKCTVNQAKTIMHFELPCYFMVDLVLYNGTMHPLIHDALKIFKLRDSEILLSTLAIPNACVSRWLAAHEYRKYGIRTNVEEKVKIPFYANNIPDRLYEKLWKIVQENKHDAGFGRLNLANACRVAYTLTTDATALPKTIGIIDQLIVEEQRKKSHFETLVSSLNTHSFSLQGIINRVKNRYMQDHTSSNINILQVARAQIIEFSTANFDLSKPSSILHYGALDTVRLQGKDEVSKFLKLKGKWNESLAITDIVVASMVAIGGVWMVWDYFRQEIKDVVVHQGKRSNQKLKFRDARDRKVGREVYGDDGVVEHTFGEAYTKRGKVKGNHHKKGMGNKTRNFVHLYGFDPTEYSFVRFVDPITGKMIDEAPHVDMSLVQSDLAEARVQAMAEDDDLIDYVRAKPGIQAYFVDQKARKAIKVDLHPHNPLAVCRSKATIAGFPEREFDLRQTGPAQAIPYDEVPALTDVVRQEGKSILRGPRDYNPVARSICVVKNSSDGINSSMFAIGYGSVLITPGHFLERNNGTMEVRTSMGYFKVENTTQLKIHHLKGRDLILIQMPKDFPPFPRKLRFRFPLEGEKCCMIESLFQQKSLSSCVSESTVVMPTEGCFYWKHWISTKEGSCGAPFVSTKDGFIVGVHGLEGCIAEKNYFITFPDDFEETVLQNIDSIEWTKHWKYNVNKVLWGKLSYARDETDAAFQIEKLTRDLKEVDLDVVFEQAEVDKWVYRDLGVNLQAVGEAESHLVTKHVIKGRCPLFQEYLASVPSARAFFEPLLGKYGPSKLNKGSFKKDFFKYKSEICVGRVDTQLFEVAVHSVIEEMLRVGFKECAFVTCPDEIVSSLNMKASVGALFKGKKKEYIEARTQSEIANLIQLSCERLFNGHMGVWNGSLKAELRPVEKLLENKTRTFTAAPIDTLLGAKVCVDDFNNLFYSLHTTAHWTVGMTKFYRGWHHLLTQLPDGWIYCHADGSRFDSSLTPYLINAIITIRKFFMEKWWIGQTMLENLYTEVVYTPILVPDGTVVKKFKGNNSGQPSTVVDNTLMVIVAMYYAIGKHTTEACDFGEFIKFFANGDDLIIAVKPDMVFILDTLQTSFDELGLTYDFSERSDKRSDLEFMSHRGILRDGVYIPKLDKERVVSILEWDRSTEIAHRAEAICAAMIEAWGYNDLLNEIRKFYLWIMEKPEYSLLSAKGVFPYIAETALRKLYLDQDASEHELERYLLAFNDITDDSEYDVVCLQAANDELKDAGAEEEKKRGKSKMFEHSSGAIVTKDRDVDTGSRGHVVPRLAKIAKGMRMPRVEGKDILNLEHLLTYKPAQEDISNVRATHKQLKNWVDAICDELGIEKDQVGVVLNGFMVWCIDNGTSPNVSGVWTMMDGPEQVEYPLKPFVENAKPTLRQIMHHFSDAAEAYIEFRNSEKAYIPRYAQIRNLRDQSLARYAFDFYEMNARTTNRAREAHLQMKAAALNNVSTRLFGLDGNVVTQEENTERHTTADVNANMHSLLGVRHM
ncbi:polyprotein [Pleione flower breaking virus]|uniref:Genome polyprotein n=1 Tax=Pleione flower breaking virus TaxID=1403565 RepID=A0A386CAG6_9POTV|nr:polyprotein [Pleione flower breaking virus]AYC81022.1 polyprotein [Pleione flower breaking virus]